MTNRIHRGLLSAAATVLIVGLGLSSCSKPAEQNAAQANAAEVNAGAQEATEQGAPSNDQSTQNAKALLKAMSDCLAAQKAFSLSYDSVFEVVSGQPQKFQIATSGTVDMNR